MHLILLPPVTNCMYVNADYILAYVMLGNYSTIWWQCMGTLIKEHISKLIEKVLSKNVMQKMKENTCTQSRNWKIVSISTLIVKR